jgi:Tfp pilus assembly protein PilO
MNKLHKTIAMMASSLLVLLGFGSCRTGGNAVKEKIKEKEAQVAELKNQLKEKQEKLYKLHSQHAQLKDAIENRAKVYGPPPAKVTVIKK